MKKNYKRYNPKSSYTDFGAAYLTRMNEITPSWGGHTFYLLVGILALVIDGLSINFFFALGVMFVCMAVVGYKGDYKRRNWSISDY